ncbi:MAG: glycosyltransferase [Nitrospiraceae bacterium]|nr:glycosyltransferase [Nitrospiraceae bacterium]
MTEKSITDNTGVRRPVKISVCHLLPALPAHGAEQLLLDISRHVDQTQISFSICLISDLGPLVEDFRGLGIPVTYIAKKSRKDFSVVFRLAKFWRQNRFDIVHTHLFTADLWGRLAGLISRIPIVSTSHTTSDPNIGRLGRWLDRVLDLRNDAVICVSEAVRRYRIGEAGFDPDKLRLIENGIDLNRFDQKFSREEVLFRLGLPTGVRWIIIVGRLVPLKGHRFLVEAMALLAKDFPDLGLLIVGDGECEPFLREQVENLGLSSRVVFLGLRRDIPDILGISEIMVLPSSREGLPIVLLEAMAAGLPVAVTPVGGIPEVVEEGKTGFFIEQNPESIAYVLRNLLENPALGRNVGKNARILVEERYDICKVAKKYEQLYQELLGGK